MGDLDSADPRIPNAFERDGDPGVGFILGIIRVAGGFAGEILDADPGDSSRPGIFGDGAAAVGRVDRSGEADVNGDFVAADGGDGAVPDDVAGVGLPAQADAAADVCHADGFDPRGGAGAANENRVAGLQTGGRGDVEFGRVDGNVVIGDGDGIIAGVRIVLPLYGDQSSPILPGGEEERAAIVRPGTAKNDAGLADDQTPIDFESAGAEENRPAKPVIVGRERSDIIDRVLDSRRVVARNRRNEHANRDGWNRNSALHISGKGEIRNAVALGIGRIVQTAAVGRDGQFRFWGRGARSSAGKTESRQTRIGKTRARFMAVSVSGVLAKQFFGDDRSEIVGVGDEFVVEENSQSGAALESGAVAIVENRYKFSVIGHVLEAEPIPGVFGKHRADLDFVVLAGNDADQAGDDQIAEGGMVVIAAAGVVALEPFAIHLVEIFAHVWLVALPVQRFDVSVHRIEISLPRHGGLWIIPQNIGQRGERLRCGKGPDGAVPFALANAVGAEFRVASLGGGDAEGRPESLGIGKLRPGIFIAGIGEAEIPRDKADFFAGVGKPVGQGLGFEEFSGIIPELLLDE